MRILRCLTPLALTVATLLGCRGEGSSTTPDEAPTPAEPSEDVDEVDEVDGASEVGDDPAPEPAAALDKASFDATVNDNMQDVSDCYVVALANEPELAGTFEAAFTIDTEGRASAVEMLEGSTLSSEPMRACIEMKAREWSFAKPADAEMRLTYSFTLEPG